MGRLTKFYYIHCCHYIMTFIIINNRARNECESSAFRLTLKLSRRNSYALAHFLHNTLPVPVIFPAHLPLFKNRFASKWRTIVAGSGSVFCSYSFSFLSCSWYWKKTFSWILIFIVWVPILKPTISVGGKSGIFDIEYRLEKAKEHGIFHWENREYGIFYISWENREYPVLI